jgi:hypothetical protein
MIKNKDKIIESDLLTENEKKLILFVLGRQFIMGECVVTNEELIEELELTKYHLSKVTKSLNGKKFFKSGGDVAGYSHIKHYGYNGFRNIGKNKRIIINEILLESFLDGKELEIEKIQKK